MVTKLILNVEEKGKTKTETKEFRFNKAVILSFMFLFLFSFVSAQPPFVQSSSLSTGYEIEIPEINPLKQNQNFVSNFHVFNISNGYPISNASTSCSIHLYNSSGTSLFEGNVPHATTDVVNEWKITLLGGNFSNTGFYGYLIQCNSSTTSLGGFANVGFEVTPYGFENSDIPLEFYIIFFGLLMIILSNFNKKLGILEQIGGVIFMIMGVITIYPGYNFINYTNLLGMLLGTVLIASGAYFFIWGQLRKRIEKQEGDED